LALHSDLISLSFILNQSPVEMPPTTRKRLPKPVTAAVVQAATPKKRASTAKTVENGAAKDPQAAAEESPATKRRKVTPKEPKAAPPPRPPIDLSQVHYKPSILPVEPKFSVQAAMDHLIQFDPRFKGLFNAMKCRPFVEPFEALDPYRTLTTSIVGQQVSSNI
jgi:DNA-3-methyladenine glycosylase II